MAGFTTAISKLSKTNYEKWSLQARALMGAQDVWDIVENGYVQINLTATGVTETQRAMEKENRMKDKAALFLLYQAVDENEFEKISDSKTAKEAWDELEKAYKYGDRVKQIKLQNLRGEMEMAQMKANEDASDYIDRIQSIVSQLKKNGDDIPQNRVVEKVLRSLTEEYENIACAIEKSKDLSVLTVE